MATTNEREFATPEQVAEAEERVAAWRRRYPEAAQVLVTLWVEQLMAVGHKRLGRILIGRPAERRNKKGG